MFRTKKIRFSVMVLILCIVFAGCKPAQKDLASSSADSGSVSSEQAADSSVASIASQSSATSTSNAGVSSLASKSSSSTVKSSSSAPVVPVRQYYSSQVGIWYELFYGSGNPYPTRWNNESRSKPIEDGYYYSYNNDKIKKDFTYLKRIGIDYAVLDDTNYHLADNGTIAMAADNCFIVADQLGDKAPKLCFAGGRPLIEGKADMMVAEMDIFYGYYNKYPDNYQIWKAKPLFINFNNPFNFGYKDPKDRFTIRSASGKISNTKAYANKFNLNAVGVWGWCFDAQYLQSEVYGITAGWSRSHNGMVEYGQPISRENGKRYLRMWLEAIKTKPETIVITGWNEHVEETGIEAVVLSQAVEGREKESLNPYYYQQLTEGYIALKTGYLENFYYQNENESQIYQYKNGKLVKVSSVPEMTAVIVVPSDYFAWSGVKFA